MTTPFTSCFRTRLRAAASFSSFNWSRPSSSSLYRLFQASHRHSSSSSRQQWRFFFFRRSSSSSSSSSSNPGSSWFRGLYASYSSLLERYPYSTQMATSGFLGGAGDATTQYLEHRWDLLDGRQPKPWDLRRLFAVSFFGVYFMGPVGHVWYKRLDAWCHRYCRRSWQMVTAKVAGDTLLFGPVCLWAFFVSVSLMEGISWRHTEQKIRRDFVPTYLVDYACWPLVQGLNFRFVPVQHQLLVVNLMCYFDDIFLSYVQHNSLPRLFQAIEDWWARLIHRRGWDTDLHELEAVEEEDDRRRKELFVQARAAEAEAAERQLRGEEQQRTAAAANAVVPLVAAVAVKSPTATS